MLTGFKAALNNLKGKGCGTAGTGGSLVTGKAIPNLTFDAERATRKAQCGGEISRPHTSETLTGSPLRFTTIPNRSDNEAAQRKHRN